MKHILTPYECLLIYLGDYSKEQQYATSLLLKMYFKNNWYKLLDEIKEHTGFKINNRYSSKCKLWSSKIKSNANNTCELCGNKNNLVAHHIIEWQYSIAGRYDISNGICLCEKCHKQIHNDEFHIKKLGEVYG